MDTKNSILVVTCPKCAGTIRINKVWYPGGCNDYGIFVLKCSKCEQVFEIDIGRDVDASNVLSGAILVEKKYRD